MTEQEENTAPAPTWPAPQGEQPDMEDVKEWLATGVCEATDGCWVQFDGVCQHGYPSWLLYLGWW